MERQNLINRLVARKLQPAGNGKALCYAEASRKALCYAEASRKALCYAEAQPKK
jgi:hypothetical protein